MVSDREIAVWQDRTPYGIILKVQPHYVEDPAFTPEQEEAIHTIARAMLIANRKAEGDKRRKRKNKEKEQDELYRSKG